MTAEISHDRLNDEDYPAYTMGRAAEMLGTTPGFLRSLDEAKLIEPNALQTCLAGIRAE